MAYFSFLNNFLPLPSPNRKQEVKEEVRSRMNNIYFMGWFFCGVKLWEFGEKKGYLILTIKNYNSE
jgi:hypothetical protein